jgi:large subunit ribosomal protein L6
MKRFFSSNSVHLSNIGKKVIKYPAIVDIQHQEKTTVSGPLGQLEISFPDFVQLHIQEPQDDAIASKKIISVSVKNPTLKKQKAMWGTARSLLNSMIEGVTEGYIVPLRLEGVGYRVRF